MIEIVIVPGGLAVAGMEGRDELEDLVDEALSESDLGEVIGGGGGVHGTNLDVEINDPSRIDEAVAVLRSTLKQACLPSSTRIRVFEPDTQEYGLDTG